MELVKEKKVEVELGQLQEIVNYLQHRPYHEVADLIQKILIVSSKIKE